jgi:hypothetical protein
MLRCESSHQPNVLGNRRRLEAPKILRVHPIDEILENIRRDILAEGLDDPKRFVDGHDGRAGAFSDQPATIEDRSQQSVVRV